MTLPGHLIKVYLSVPAEDIGISTYLEGREPSLFLGQPLLEQIYLRNRARVDAVEHRQIVADPVPQQHQAHDLCEVIISMPVEILVGNAALI